MSQQNQQQTADELPLRKRLLLKVFEDSPRYLQPDTRMHIQIPNKPTSSISAPNSAKSPILRTPLERREKCPTTNSPEKKPHDKKGFLAKLELFNDDLEGEFWTRPLPSSQTTSPCTSKSNALASTSSDHAKSGESSKLVKALSPTKNGQSATSKSSSSSSSSSGASSNSSSRKDKNQQLRELDAKLDKILKEKIMSLKGKAKDEELQLWERVYAKLCGGTRNKEDLTNEQKEIEAFFKKEMSPTAVKFVPFDAELDAELDEFGFVSSGSSPFNSPKNETDLQDQEIKGSMETPSGTSRGGVPDFFEYLKELKQARMETLIKQAKNTEKLGKHNSSSSSPNPNSTKHAEILQLINLKKQIMISTNPLPVPVISTTSKDSSSDSDSF